MASADVVGTEWSTFKKVLAEMRDMKVNAKYLEIMVPLDNMGRLFNEEKRVSTSDIKDILDEVCTEIPMHDIETYAFRIRELLESIFVTKLYDEDERDPSTTGERIIQVDRISAGLERFFMTYVDYGYNHLRDSDDDKDDKVEKCENKSKKLRNLVVSAEDILILLLSIQLKYLIRHDTETLLSNFKDSKKTSEFKKIISELENKRLVPVENVIADFEGKTAGRRIWEKIHMIRASDIIVLKSKENQKCLRCLTIISEEMEYSILDSCNHYFCAKCARQQFTKMNGLCPKCDKLVRFWVSKETFQEYVARPTLVYPENYIPRSITDW